MRSWRTPNCSRKGSVCPFEFGGEYLKLCRLQAFNPPPRHPARGPHLRLNSDEKIRLDQSLRAPTPTGNALSLPAATSITVALPQTQNPLLVLRGQSQNSTRRCLFIRAPKICGYTIRAWSHTDQTPSIRASVSVLGRRRCHSKV